MSSLESVSIPRRGTRAAPGFTLIELLVSLAIVATLTAIAVPVVELSQRRSKERELKVALREIRTAIDRYKDLTDKGVIERPLGTSGYPPNLEVLVTGVRRLDDPAARPIYLLRRIPDDPLMRTTAQSAWTWGLRSYESSPDQPRPGADVFDVYSRAPGVGLNGVPYSKW